MIDLRNELRAAKQWELSDKIRDRLNELGIIIEDKKGKRVLAKEIVCYFFPHHNHGKL